VAALGRVGGLAGAGYAAGTNVVEVVGNGLVVVALATGIAPGRVVALGSGAVGGTAATVGGTVGATVVIATVDGAAGGAVDRAVVGRRIGFRRFVVVALPDFFGFVLGFGPDVSLTTLLVVEAAPLLVPGTTTAIRTATTTPAPKAVRNLIRPR
jgi:hypothetical protein